MRQPGRKKGVDALKMVDKERTFVVK